MLAQKTYTLDCIEHIVRKNDRKVAQYYGIDQHEAIISRKEFYLALRLRNANKCGWNKGIQVLKTYMSGTMKGYVLVIPGWYGFEAPDYVKASLEAYGISIPERSLYPDYVTGSIKEDNNTGPEITRNEEFRHFVEVSDAEFMSEPTISPEEYEQLQEKEPEYISVLKTLKGELRSKVQEPVICRERARAWCFSMKEKKMLTIDKNGVSFNYACYETVRAEKVEMYYNPVEDMIRIAGYRGDESDSPESIAWRKEGQGMCRCPAPAFCGIIYKCMCWNNEYKYTMFGRKVIINGKEYLEFSLEHPMIRVKYSKTSEKEATLVLDKLEIAMEEAKNTGAFFSEMEDKPEKYADYLTDKVDNKSRAVYFLDEHISANTPISITDHEARKYDPDFICMLREKCITPIEGWGYHGANIRWLSDGFELYPASMPNIRTAYYEDDSEPIIQEFGWTTQYTFPSKDSVRKKIEAIENKVNY